MPVTGNASAFDSPCHVASKRTLACLTPPLIDREKRSDFSSSYRGRAFVPASECPPSPRLFLNSGAVLHSIALLGV